MSSNITLISTNRGVGMERPLDAGTEETLMSDERDFSIDLIPYRWQNPLATIY